LLTTSPPTSPLFPYTTLFRSWLPPPQRNFRRPNAAMRQCDVKSLRSINCVWGGDGNISTFHDDVDCSTPFDGGGDGLAAPAPLRSEEHTSELQSRSDLVCRLL